MGGSVGDSMVEDMQLQLRQALEDKEVRAIVLAIDSPGGEVTASDIIYEAVKRAKAQKPVVVSMGSMAASGGYYIACGGSYLFAHDTTFTGSIGVIMQSLNYSELMGKVGVDMITFKSGKFKDMLSGTRTMTPEEREYVQALIMQTYGKFVGIVARDRGLPEEQLRAGVADGRVLSGQDALAAKLIDEIGGEDAAIRKAKELGKCPSATVVKYETAGGLGRYLKLLGNAEPKKLEVNLTPRSALPLEPGRLYLLPSLLAP
jgi:protease-4